MDRKTRILRQLPFRVGVTARRRAETARRSSACARLAGAWPSSAARAHALRRVPVVAAGLARHAGGGARGRARWPMLLYDGRAWHCPGRTCVAARREPGGVARTARTTSCATRDFTALKVKDACVRPPARGAGRASRCGRTRAPTRLIDVRVRDDARHRVARPGGRIAVSAHLPRRPMTGPRTRARVRAGGRAAGAGRVGRGRGCAAARWSTRHAATALLVVRGG